jgi:hypothetical protein
VSRLRRGRADARARARAKPVHVVPKGSRAQAEGLFTVSRRRRVHVLGRRPFTATFTASLGRRPAAFSPVQAFCGWLPADDHGQDGRWLWQSLRMAPRATFPAVTRREIAAQPGTPNDAELRKAARANASVRVFRQGEQEAEADADAEFWDRIPIDERAEFVWKLSLELHAIAHPGKPYEPGLSRSVARIIGR